MHASLKVQRSRTPSTFHPSLFHARPRFQTLPSASCIVEYPSLLFCPFVAPATPRSRLAIRRLATFASTVPPPYPMGVSSLLRSGVAIRPCGGVLSPQIGRVKSRGETQLDVRFHRRLQRRRTKDDDDGVVLGASMADPGVVDGTTRVRGKPIQVRGSRDASHGGESDRRGVETRVQQRRPRHHTQPRCACLEPALGQPWCHEKGAFWKIEKEHDAAAHRLTFNNAFPR